MKKSHLSSQCPFNNLSILPGGPIYRRVTLVLVLLIQWEKETCLLNHHNQTLGGFIYQMQPSFPGQKHPGLCHYYHRFFCYDFALHTIPFTFYIYSPVMFLMPCILRAITCMPMESAFADSTLLLFYKQALTVQLRVCVHITIGASVPGIYWVAGPLQSHRKLQGKLSLFWTTFAIFHVCMCFMCQTQRLFQGIPGYTCPKRDVNIPYLKYFKGNPYCTLQG